MNKNKGSSSKKKKKKKKKKQGEAMELNESWELDDRDVLTKKVNTMKPKKKLFEGIDCPRSFYLFTKENKCRITLYRMTSHSCFETVILILIILSSIKLAVDSYLVELAEDDPITIGSA